MRLTGNARRTVDGMRPRTQRCVAHTVSASCVKWSWSAEMLTNQRADFPDSSFALAVFAKVVRPTHDLKCIENACYNLEKSFRYRSSVPRRLVEILASSGVLAMAILG